MATCCQGPAHPGGGKTALPRDHREPPPPVGTTGGGGGLPQRRTNPWGGGWEGPQHNDNWCTYTHTYVHKHYSDMVVAMVTLSSSRPLQWSGCTRPTNASLPPSRGGGGGGGAQVRVWQGVGNPVAPLCSRCTTSLPFPR